MKKHPKRITSIGTTTGKFYKRECPQNKIFIEPQNNEVVGELFKKNGEYGPALLHCL